MEKRKKNPHAVALGRKGGAARRDALTPERRSEIARVAINTRWGKPKPKTRRTGQKKAA